MKMNNTFCTDGSSNSNAPPGMSRSKSVDGLVAVSKRGYDLNHRQERPTPSVFYIRAKKKNRNTGSVLRMADVESL